MRSHRKLSEYKGASNDAFLREGIVPDVQGIIEPQWCGEHSTGSNPAPLILRMRLVDTSISETWQLRYV